MPQVSVIIPLYNKGRYIGHALDSVFAQTFADYEVVVVDDGSTDDGPDIVRQYTDPRLRLIQQENAGPGAARNRGMKETNAKYVAFLDADDEWLPEFLRATYRALKKEPGCGLCATSFYYGTVNGDIGYQYNEGAWTLPVDLNPSEFKYHIDSLHSAGALLCTREVVQKFGGFYENGCTYGEDAYLWLKVVLNCRVYRLSKPLLVYHTEASGLSIGSGRKFVPPKPFLLDPDPVRAVCPEEYADMLERFLSHWALIAYHYCLGVGRERLCENFLISFPLMKKVNFVKYLLLRSKLLLPGPYRLFQRAFRKNNLRSNV